jgi:hypothetical protein
LRAKKPTGFKENPAYSTGMTGQSSGWIMGYRERVPEHHVFPLKGAIR